MTLSLSSRNVPINKKRYFTGFSAFIVLLLTAGVFFQPSASLEAGAVGKKAFGTVYLENLATGRRELLRKRFGKGPVILNFWATYCIPCAQEMPELQKLSRRYPKAELLFINIDPGRKIRKVKKKVKAWGIKDTVLLDKYQLAAKRYIPGLKVPATFLIGSDGKIKYLSLGYHKTTIANLNKALKKLR